MIKLEAKHFLTGEELNQEELIHLLDLAQDLKLNRGESSHQVLKGKHLALLFEKPSLRTRLSFMVGMQELGGHIVESLSSTRKKETAIETISVVGGYCHGVMIRTFEHKILERMSKVSPIPIINGLTDAHHPCQALADALTLKECFGKWKGIHVCYVGDGNNVLASLLLILPFLGINLRYSCPKGHGPDSLVLERSLERAKQAGGSIQRFETKEEAAKGAHAVYTDVWTSMGSEDEEEEHKKIFQAFQVDEDLMELADLQKVFMHCMPIHRGQEVSNTLPDQDYSVIYQQSENRLHVQKALLIGLLGEH